MDCHTTCAPPIVAYDSYGVQNDAIKGMPTCRGVTPCYVMRQLNAAASRRLLYDLDKQ